MKLVKICTLVLAMASVPFAVQADNHAAPGGQMMGPGGAMPGPGMQRGPGMMGPGMMTPPPFAGVEFNEKQRKRIEEMMAQERKSHQARVEKMQQLQQQLQKLYMADKWDTGAITKLYEQVHAEQRKTIAAMAEARNKVVDLMTKEQREQMKRFHQEQVERFDRQPAPVPQQ
ncbi:MAG: Spy/CpxP family protein refolding chaperone [Chromatiales bacterium]|nr:Spy/CpxP family protein refolding chaperone [Chromatiales bacterium]